MPAAGLGRAHAPRSLASARRAVVHAVALVAVCGWPRSAVAPSAAAPRDALGGAADDVLRIGLVTGEGGPEVGSNALRTRMLLEVMKQRHAALEAQLGFRFEVALLGRQGKTPAAVDAFVADVFGGARAPHVVVLNKERPHARLEQRLGEQCVLIALDMIDDLGSFAWLRRARGVLPADRSLPRALVLVQSNATIQHLRQLQALAPAVPPEASAWLALAKHQHTNVGGWRVRTSAQAAARPLRRIGILSGNDRHEPDATATLDLATRACFRGASLVLINEHDKAGRSTVLRTYGCDAHRRVALPPVTTHAAIWRRSTRGAVFSGGLRDAPLFNFSSQQKYHDVAWVDTIDLALLWLRAGMDRLSPSNYSETLFRPHTRMLHWWSHGVPTLFYPFASYVETAREVGYRTCGAGAQLPIVASAVQVSKMLRKLSREPESVRALAAAGLRGAARFSAEQVCADLLRTLREHVRRLREGCGKGASRRAR